MSTPQPGRPRSRTQFAAAANGTPSPRNSPRPPSASIRARDRKLFPPSVASSCGLPRNNSLSDFDLLARYVADSALNDVEPRKTRSPAPRGPASFADVGEIRSRNRDASPAPAAAVPMRRAVSVANFADGGDLASAGGAGDFGFDGLSAGPHASVAQSCLQIFAALLDADAASESGRSTPLRRVRSSRAPLSELGDSASECPDPISPGEQSLPGSPPSEGPRGLAPPSPHDIASAFRSPHAFRRVSPARPPAPVEEEQAAPEAPTAPPREGPEKEEEGVEEEVHTSQMIPKALWDAQRAASEAGGPDGEASAPPSEAGEEGEGVQESRLVEAGEEGSGLGSWVGWLAAQAAKVAGVGASLYFVGPLAPLLAQRAAAVALANPKMTSMIFGAPLVRFVTTHTPLRAVVPIVARAGGAVNHALVSAVLPVALSRPLAPLFFNRLLAPATFSPAMGRLLLEGPAAHATISEQSAPLFSQEHVLQLLYSPSVAPLLFGPRFLPLLLSPDNARRLLSPSTARHVLNARVAAHLLGPSVAPLLFSPPVAERLLSPELAPVILAPHCAALLLGPEMGPLLSGPVAAPHLLSPHVAPLLFSPHVSELLLGPVAGPLLLRNVAPRLLSPALAEAFFAPHITRHMFAVENVRLMLAPHNTRVLFSRRLAPLLFSGPVGAAMLGPVAGPALLSPETAPLVISPETAPLMFGEHAAGLLLGPDFGPHLYSPHFGPVLLSPRVAALLLQPGVAEHLLGPRAAPHLMGPHIAPLLLGPECGPLLLSPPTARFLFEPHVARILLTRPYVDLLLSPLVAPLLFAEHNAPFLLDNEENARLLFSPEVVPLLFGPDCMPLLLRPHVLRLLLGPVALPLMLSEASARRMRSAHVLGAFVKGLLRPRALLQLSLTMTVLSAEHFSQNVRAVLRAVAATSPAARARAKSLSAWISRLAGRLGTVGRFLGYAGLSGGGAIARVQSALDLSDL
eukprot:tig00021281_g19934.t1